MTGPRDSWGHELALLNEELHALDADIAGARAASARGRRTPRSASSTTSRARKVHGEPVELADGSPIAIRPLEPADAGELRRGLKRLSALTAFKRFRARVTEVSPEELDSPHTHRPRPARGARGAGPGGRQRPSAWRATCATPRSPSQAELTYVVADTWQHRGVGSALIDRLAVRARKAGVERFILTTLAVDTHAPRLLTRVADPIGERDHDGIIETTARLRPLRDEP